MLSRKNRQKQKKKSLGIQKLTYLHTHINVPNRRSRSVLSSLLGAKHRWPFKLTSSHTGPTGYDYT